MAARSSSVLPTHFLCLVMDSKICAVGLVSLRVEVLPSPKDIHHRLRRTALFELSCGVRVLSRQSGYPREFHDANGVVRSLLASNATDRTQVWGGPFFKCTANPFSLSGGRFVETGSRSCISYSCRDASQSEGCSSLAASNSFVRAFLVVNGVVRILLALAFDELGDLTITN